MKRGLRISCVFAHPDDADLWAGGTLINHADHGDAIHISCLFASERLRQREAREAARLIGARVEFVTAHDRLVQRIAAAEPDVILTHWIFDGHPDHRYVAQAVNAALPDLVIGHGLKPLVFATSPYNNLGIDGRRFVPTDVIDVSAVWHRKVDLVQCHRSQPTEYFLTMARSHAVASGAETGVELAEGFRQQPVLGHIRRHRPLLTT